MSGSDNKYSGDERMERLPRPRIVKRNFTEGADELGLTG